MRKSTFSFLVVVSVIAGCSSDSITGAANVPATQMPAAGATVGAPPASQGQAGASSSTTGSSTTGGAGASGSRAAGSGGAGTPAVTPTPTAGTSAGAAGDAAGAAGAAPAAGAAAMAGAGGSPMPAAGVGGAGGAPAASNLMDCKSEDVGPCGTFMTQGGMKIQLGPYGAVMEKNVGKGFEARLASGDSDGGASCRSVVASFGEDPAQSAPLLDTAGIDFALYTVYRPANWVEGEKVPVITWGNGTCAKTEGYGALLRYVASHGFFVVASNSRWVGSGNSAMTKALDFVEAANKDSASPYYQRLDTEKIGAMGHSQGGMATITAANDSRIKSVIIWNGGSKASKPYLAVTGDRDIGNPTVSGLRNAITGNPPAAWLFYHMTVGEGSVPGHLTLMTQPERVIEPTVAWFKYQLQNDMDSRAWFVGTDCKLCAATDQYEYGQKNLP